MNLSEFLWFISSMTVSLTIIFRWTEGHWFWQAKEKRKLMEEDDIKQDSIERKRILHLVKIKRRAMKKWSFQ